MSIYSLLHSSLEIVTTLDDRDLNIDLTSIFLTYLIRVQIFIKLARSDYWGGFISVGAANNSSRSREIIVASSTRSSISWITVFAPN